LVKIQALEPPARPALAGARARTLLGEQPARRGPWHTPGESEPISRCGRLSAGRTQRGASRLRDRLKMQQADLLILSSPSPGRHAGKQAAGHRHRGLPGATHTRRAAESGPPGFGVLCAWAQDADHSAASA